MAPRSSRRLAAARRVPPVRQRKLAVAAPGCTRWRRRWSWRPDAGLQGLSIVKPPYGIIAAIDVNNAKLLFQTLHGDTPDAVRNNPVLRGLNIPKTGQPGSVGIMITKTVLVSGDPQVTAPLGRPRGAMLRAYDKQSGAQVGEVLMPAPISGSPMTLRAQRPSVHRRRRQRWQLHEGEYIAYALPPSEVRSGN